MKEQYQDLLSRLCGIEGFKSFYLLYARKEQGNDKLDAMLSAFREYRINMNKPLNTNEEYLVDYIKNRCLELCFSENKCSILFFDDNQVLGESILEEFRNDFESCKTGDFDVGKNKFQRYKTWTESTIYQSYKDNGLTEKYQESYHPAIYSVLGRSFINAGYFSNGVPLIIKAINYANKRNNPFWHTPFGIFGCTECIWELIRLLTKNKLKRDYEEFLIPLFKLLFLYLSRSIAAAGHAKLLQGMDFYRNRANLVRDHYDIFVIIFLDYGFVANMDVQYISDTYLGFKLCSDLGVSSLGSELLNDSRKMRSYGSLSNLYEDSDYKYIEDANWLELVERGRYRSNVIADNLINEMLNGNLIIPDDVLESMMVDILNQNPNNPVNFNWKKHSNV